MCNLQIASITFRNFLCLYILIHLLWEVKRQQSEMKAKKLFIWAILTRHICSHTPNANVYRKKRDIAILNKKSKDMQNLSQMAALKVYESASLAKCAKVFSKTRLMIYDNFSKRNGSDDALWCNKSFVIIAKCKWEVKDSIHTRRICGSSNIAPHTACGDVGDLERNIFLEKLKLNLLWCSSIVGRKSFIFKRLS